MPALQQGAVVSARVADATGENPKQRPLVVVSSNAEVQANAPLVAVAITTKFHEPLSADEIPLPWHAAGRVRTGLRRPSVAVCTWRQTLSKSQIVRVEGVVPMDKLHAILLRLRASHGG